MTRANDTHLQLPEDSVVRRCIAWNMQRYNREYDPDLTIKLLLEEVGELFDSDLKVQVLDAVGDIMFVAIGAMWKMGIPAQLIHDVFYKDDLSKMGVFAAYNRVALLNNVFFANAPESILDTCMPGLHLAAFSSFVIALSAIRGMGMQDAVYRVMSAVCDSNDTKSVPAGKVDAKVKANVDKGPSFVPPTEALQAIVDFYAKDLSSNGRLAS